MQTPYFLISHKKLNENIDAFKTALNTVWEKNVFGYSVKTNSLPWLLKYLHSNNISAEVVSDEEYELARLCGFKDNQIIFNGPIKGESFFKRAIENNAIVNLDSKNDLVLLKKIACGNGQNIGIRINMPPEIFNTEDIGYEKDGFRFGFSEKSGELSEAISVIREVFGDCSFGLHLHFNSVTRSVDVYRATAEYAIKIINKYSIKPSFIDIGGGFFGGVPGKPSPTEYLSAVKEILVPTVNPKETALIIEPGSAIIGSVVELHTTVLDVKNNEKTRIVTTDGSRVHIDPLWIKTRYMYSVDSTNNTFSRQVICGYTCMDHDRIMVLENEKELSQGDKIIYYRVGAYTMTFGGMFIKRYPDVYVEMNKEVIKVRTEPSLEDYYQIHS